MCWNGIFITSPRKNHFFFNSFFYPEFRHKILAISNTNSFTFLTS
nr:MAG TPA: hypothetical protein [Caudoviricetes sp.]